MNALIPQTPLEAAKPWIELSDVGFEQKSDEPMPLEIYGDLCRYVGQATNALRWAIADLLNYGEFKYGETYHQYTDLFGLAYDTLKQYKRIGKAITPEERRQPVKWSYWHRLAALERPQRDELVERIIADDFEDAHELGQEVTAMRQESEPETELFPACPSCGGKLTARHCKGCGLGFIEVVWWLVDIERALGELPERKAK